MKILRTDVTAADLATSAYKGHHVREGGALAKLIAAGQAGEIERGTVVLVESMDRFTRQAVGVSIDLLRVIADAGLILLICDSDVIVDRHVLDTEMAFLIVALIQRAHGESKRKSEMVAEAWRAKHEAARENNHLLTSHCPGWLIKCDERQPDGTWFREDGPKADIVREIFAMSGEGMKATSIATDLNKRSVPTLGASESSGNTRDAACGWRHTRVERLLKDRRVLGWFQRHRSDGNKRIPVGEPLRGYYPEIVDPSVFQNARQNVTVLSKTKGRTGRGGAAANLFGTLARCGCCGGALTITGGGRSRPTAKTPRDPAYYASYTCDGSHGGRTCPNHGRYKLRSFEPALLQAIAFSPPPLPRDAKKIDATRRDVDRLDTEIAALESTYPIVMRMAGKSATAAAAFERLSVELDGLKERRDVLALQLTGRSDDQLQAARDAFNALLRSALDYEHPDRSLSREKLRTLMPRVVERITYYPTRVELVVRSIDADFGGADRAGDGHVHMFHPDDAAPMRNFIPDDIGDIDFDGTRPPPAPLPVIR
jgi:DNA invertase Pin-like site-specific DNA recombinase